MIIARAFGDGLRRVHAAPSVLFGVYLLTLLVALPLASVVRGAIGDDLGPSLTAGRVADGVDYEWWQAFEERATGLATTFTPSIIGFAAPLGNLSHLADHTAMPAAIAGVVGAYLVLWAFVVGGVLDRYARQRPTRPSGQGPVGSRIERGSARRCRSAPRRRLPDTAGPPDRRIPRTAGERGTGRLDCGPSLDQVRSGRTPATGPRPRSPGRGTGGSRS